MKNIVIIATLMLLCAAGCKKDKASEDQLPPATQTGANTFGCLVNGKVFVPKGYDGTGRPNPHVQYDYDLKGQPYLSIKGAHYTNSNFQAGVNIGFNNLTSIGYYEIGSKFSIDFGWEEVINNCGNASWDPNVYCRGGVYYKVRYTKRHHQWNICLCIQKLILRYCQNN